MKSKKLLSFLIVLSLVLTTLVGCSSSSGGGEEETSDHVFTVASSCDVGNLNPHTGESSLYGLNYVYEPLVTYEDGEIKPMLADTWDISEDGLVYTFHIRDNAMFSDGTVCDANSVVKNFDAVFMAEGTWDANGVYAKTDEYYAADDHTFVLKFKEPYYPALQELAAVRPWRILGDAGFQDDGSTAGGIKAPIGTGPFALSDYVENEYAEFVRNEYYWGEAPKLDKFRVQVVTDSQTAVSALESGQVDMLYDMYESSLMSIETFQSLQESGYASAISGPVLTRAVTLNSSQKPLDDFNVRKAIILAVDRKTMVDDIFGGLEEMAQSYYAPSVMYCDVGLKGYEYDPEEAGRLLDEAGWVLEDGAEYRTKDGEVLEMTFYYDASHEVQTRIAQIFQSDLKKVGIKLNIVGEEADANIGRIYGGDFQIGYTVSWGDPQDSYSTLNAMSLEGWTDEQFALAPCEGYDEFAATVQSLFSEVDPAVIQEKHDYLLHYIEDQYCILPISYQTNRAIAQPGTEGIAFGYSNTMPMSTVTPPAE